MSIDAVIEDTNVNQNFVFAPGGIVYTYGAIGKVLPYAQAQTAVRADAMSFVTLSWDTAKSSLTCVLNHYPAVSVADQNKLVGILSDDV